MRTTRTLSALALGLALMLCSSCGGGGGFPSTPDGTVTHVAEQLKNNHPEVLWEALPASYQADVTTLVHEFGQNVDAEIYGKVVTLLQKLVGILQTKKEIIMQSSMMPEGMVDRENMDLKWDSVVGVLDTLVNSDLGDVEKVKTLDVRQFAATTGTKLMTQAAEVSKVSPEDPYQNEFMSKLENMTVELVSTEGDTAKVRITVPDEQPEEMDLVKVEDRWIPKEMADSWADEIAEAREQIAKLGNDEDAAQTKMMAMGMFGMVEALLDQIANVETVEEFDAAIQGLLGGMMGGMGPGPGDFPSE